MVELAQEVAKRVGSTLRNKWTLDRLIGTGGMAAVYVASHRIGRREAIKILHADVAKDPELRARFEQEAHAANRLKHPGAVEVRDIDVAEDGAPFLVMELLEGESLAAIARRDAFTIADVLRWADELLDVLAAAHDQGIIHRDIKPDNLFIQTDGRLKVLDFGIARVRETAVAKPQTRAGETLGTATYMPPEQIHGHPIDPRADVFAVGSTLFRLLAKRRVHEASNDGDMLMKMGSLQAPHLCEVAPEIPRDVGLVVDRALMFHREDRYPDARTMQSDVRALRDGQAPPYATLHEREPTTQASRVAHVSHVQAGAQPSSFVTKAASRVALVGSGASSESEHPDTPSPETVDASRFDPKDLQTRPIPRTFPGDGGPSVEVSLVPASTAGPLVDSTLRSLPGPEGKGRLMNPEHVVPVEVIHPTPRVIDPVELPRPIPKTPVGPTTHVSGMEAVALPPGESIRVVEAPPRPKKRLGLPGTEVSIWPLVLVGIVFASIGVGATLFIMLKDAPPPDPSPSRPAETAHPQHPAPPAPPAPPAHPTHAPTVHR